MQDTTINRRGFLGASAGAAGAALCAPLDRERPQDWIGISLGARREGGGAALNGVEGHGRDGAHRMAGVYALGPAAWPYVPDREWRRLLGRTYGRSSPLVLGGRWRGRPF